MANGFTYAVLVLLLTKRIKYITPSVAGSVVVTGMLVSPAVQNYAWGKPGKTSAVADLAAASIKRFVRKDDEPYAEVIWQIKILLSLYKL